jgi:transcription termination factor NusB
MRTDVPSTTLALRSIPAAWYSADTNDSDDPAREAYSNAVKLFNQNLTQDECKRIWMEDKTDLESVQKAVNIAKERWEARTNSKARKWLTRFSERVMHYGKVMDTLANYNPEYCALAWGTMKFLLMVSSVDSLSTRKIGTKGSQAFDAGTNALAFPENACITARTMLTRCIQAVLNHEEYITQLSKSLSQIASALPRINITILLYPTTQIKHTVSTLYAHLLKFLIRATKWYSEGKFKHFITAVFRPAPLRFKDLLEEIRTCSETVDQLAMSAGQAEQRNMHVLLQDMYREMMGKELSRLP